MFEVNRYYVYAHYRLTTDEIFYIGKGQRDRAQSKMYRNSYWHNIVNRDGYRTEIMYRDLPESHAYDIERELIKRYGRADLGCGPLVNMADGGEGRRNYIPTSETREKQRRSMLGKNTKKHSPEIVEKQSISHQGQIAWNKGRAMEKEWIENLRISHIGLKQTEECKEKRSRFFKNSIWIVNDDLKIRSRITKTEIIPEGWRRGRNFK